VSEHEIHNEACGCVPMPAPVTVMYKPAPAPHAEERCATCGSGDYHKDNCPHASPDETGVMTAPPPLTGGEMDDETCVECSGQCPSCGFDIAALRIERDAMLVLVREYADLWDDSGPLACEVGTGCLVCRSKDALKAKARA
jgi:hypothetical protein